MTIIGFPQFWRLGRPPVDRCFQGLRFPFRDCTARMYRIGIIVRAIQSTGRSLVRGKVRTDKVQALILTARHAAYAGERERVCVYVQGKRRRERASVFCGCERKVTGIEKEEEEEETGRYQCAKTLPRYRARGVILSASWKIPNDE